MVDGTPQRVVDHLDVEVNEADLRVMDLSRSLRGDSYRGRVGLLEQERFLDERLGRLDERLRLGLRRVETGRLSGLRVGDP